MNSASKDGIFSRPPTPCGNSVAKGEILTPVIELPFHSPAYASKH
jgi:hypothetical protein